MRLVSWNVNGIRAAARRGLIEWLTGQDADVFCLQETKAHPDQVDESLREPQSFHTFWACAERRGYSGVALFVRREPLEVTAGLGLPRFDSEGRVLSARYPQFLLFNVYFPNGKMNDERLQYKMDFYEAFLGRLVALRDRGERIVICGDYNTAHTEIDLSHPKENVKVSGFLPQEREWMDRLAGHGFIDTFRMFHADGGHYTWWDLKTRARERNIGWRLDYFFVSDNLAGAVRDAAIHPEVFGSDHCPVSLTLDV